MNKVAFIIGITGQDGSYLAELLLDKGYTVYGLESDKEKNSLINKGKSPIKEEFLEKNLHYPWLKTLPMLERSFVLSDLMEATKSLHLESIVFMQSGCEEAGGVRRERR